MRTPDVVKWTVEKASREFGLNPKTLRKRIASIGIAPAFDGRDYTTQQIASAVFGDIEGERLREIRAKADGLELENARKRGEWVEAAVFVREYHRVLIAMRQTIMNSKLTETEKHDVLLALSEIQLDPDTPAKPAKAKRTRAKRKAVK